MPLRLVLLADTHVPRRARDLPGQVWDAVADADVVMHAGDWVDVAARRRGCSRRRGRLVGVHGNNDGRRAARAAAAWRASRLGGLTARRGSRDRRRRPAGRPLDVEYAGADVLVFGHSHIPWDTTTLDRYAAAEPGLANRRRRQPRSDLAHRRPLPEAEPGRRGPARRLTHAKNGTRTRKPQTVVRVVSSVPEVAGGVGSNRQPTRFSGRTLVPTELPGRCPAGPGSERGEQNLTGAFTGAHERCAGGDSLC